MRPPPQIGVVWPRRSDVRDALLPLWADGTVQVLQLTVEQAFRGELGDGYTGPLTEAAARGDVVAHGVMASPMSPRDAISVDGLRRTQAVLARWPCRWFTDHFGCSRAAGWQAAPLPLPASRALVETTRDHLKWVAEALEVPVGLENLALAFGVDDALWQPDLVDAMVRPIGGLVLLDLHNLWCQAINLDLDPVALLERWPLDLVRELHVAGGSWCEFPEGRFRRDTHDGPTPEAVFDLLPEALARCPAVEVVTFERLRGSVDDPEALRADVRRLAAMVAAPGPARAAPALPAAPPWREDLDPHATADALFRAARAERWEAFDAAGWGLDPRARRAATELCATWGQPVPGASASG